MKATVVIAAAIAMLSAPLLAQELKPVPKDSVRVYIPGCSKGYIFTTSARTTDEPGSADFPEGVHLRMNVPKKIMADIKAHEGTMIEITGLMRKGQDGPDGVGLGGGVRIGPGPTSTSGGGSPSAFGNQIMIDVEGWRQIVGTCPSR